jgi:hypothetical protein
LWRGRGGGEEEEERLQDNISGKQKGQAKQQKHPVVFCQKKKVTKLTDQVTSKLG